MTDTSATSRDQAGHSRGERSDRCRIGVFYDGTWFSYVSDFYATGHPRAARLSLGGLHDSMRWYIHARTGIELEACEVTQAHYVRGRSATPSSTFDAVLADAGVTRHDIELHGGKEKGVDVYLALEAWERATTLDCVVLITGDADFVPLVNRLVGRGVRVVVPTIDTSPDTAGSAALHTARQLRAATPDAPTLDELFAPIDLDDYPLRFPFLRSAGTTTPAARARASRRAHSCVDIAVRRRTRRRGGRRPIRRA